MRRKKPDGAYSGPEWKFQSSAMVLARSMFGRSALVVHVPNGRNAGSKRSGAFWSGQGVVSGMPDIMAFDGSGRGRPGLAIELKVFPNKPDENQLRIHDLLRSCGWRVEVCYGLGEVERVISSYL